MQKESTFKKHCLVVDEWFINGRNGTQAWKKYYPNITEDAAAVRFNEMVRNSKIQEYIAEKEQTISKDYEVTIDTILSELEEARKKALESLQINIAVLATREKAKLLGFYEKHNEQKKSLDPKLFDSFIDNILKS